MVTLDSDVSAPGLLSDSVMYALVVGQADVVAGADPSVAPPNKVALLSCIVLTLEPNRPKVYAPTTSAKTSVPAMRMIVAITGVTPFLPFLTLSLFMKQSALEAYNIHWEVQVLILHPAYRYGFKV